jgi:hypothetical protein
MLKARAAQERSLSDFLKKELERVAARPTMREWLERTRLAKPIVAELSADQAVRELRDER